MTAAAVLSLLAVLVGLSIARGDQRAGFAFLAVPVVVVVLIRPEVGLFLLTFAVFSLDWLSYGLRIIPTQAAWLVDLVVAAIIVAAIMRKLVVRGGRTRLALLDQVLLLAFALSVLSAVYNGVHPTTYLAGFRSEFKYILLFYALRGLNLSPEVFRRWIACLFALAWLQIPVTILQFAVYGQRDLVSGTLGLNANQPLAFVLIAMGSLGLALYAFHDRRLAYGLLMPAAFIPFALGSVRAAFLYVPIAVAIVMRKWLSRRTLVLLLTVLALLILVYQTAFNAMVSLTLPNLDKADLLSLDWIIAEETGTTKGGELARLEAVSYAGRLISAEPFHTLLGVGLGNGTPSALAGADGRYYTAYASLRLFRTQMARTLLEQGYLGLFLGFAILWCIYVTNRQAAQVLHNQTYWGSLSGGFTAVIVMYALYTVYYPVWTSDSCALVFWGIAAALYTVAEQARRRAATFEEAV